MIAEAQGADSGRVLLVDADAADARLVIAALSDVAPFDFEIEFATSLAEAVEHLSQQTYDLVLLDLELPGVDVDEAIEQLAGTEDRGGFIVLARPENEARAMAALDQGADDYVLKGTLHQAELGRAMRYALERQQLMQSSRHQQGQLTAAIEAQKLWLVGRMAASVAHEFNNLLTGLMGEAELLRELVGRKHPAHSHAETIARGLERSALLTRQLVSFSRRRSYAARVVNLDRIVAGMVPVLENVLGSTVRLSIATAATPPLVRAAPPQVEQLLLNLVVNARDANDTTGAVMVSTAVVDRPSGKHVLLSVRDDGVGMESHTVARIFEPFFTTKTDSRRVGLGLSAVSDIVRGSQGELDVESVPGKGTEFRILLPVADGVEEPSGDYMLPDAGEGVSARILLVEDEEPIRVLMERALTAAGYDVVSAEDGASALATGRRFRSGIDLLLTDVVVPHLNGRDLSEELRRQLPGDEDVVHPRLR